jgi:hypothetical protein
LLNSLFFEFNSRWFLLLFALINFLIFEFLYSNSKSLFSHSSYSQVSIFKIFAETKKSFISDPQSHAFQTIAHQIVDGNQAKFVKSKLSLAKIFIIFHKTAHHQTLKIQKSSQE